MSEQWNFVDLKLAEMRLNKIKKYIPKDSIVLDVGCGYHYKLLKQLRDYIKKGYGIDFTVSEKEEKKITLFSQDISKDKFPIKDNSVDIVINLAVIKHLISPTTMLSEIYRVLNSSGILLLTTPTPPSKPILEFCCHAGIFKNKDALDHKIYYSKNMLVEILKKHNFNIIKHSYFQFGLNQFIVAKPTK